MTTRAASWDRKKARRLRRIGLAAVVLVMHALILQQLLSAKQTFHMTPAARGITWIALSPPTPNTVRAVPANTPGPRARVNAKSRPLAKPRSEPQLAPPATTPSQEPGLAVLQQYMVCGLMDDNKRSPEERERCAALRRGLATGPVPPHVPTEQEEATRRRLEHELAVQNAPSRVPCVNGPMVDPICVINGLLKGFGGMDSYANHVYRPTPAEQFDSHFPTGPKGDPRNP